MKAVIGFLGLILVAASGLKAQSTLAGKVDSGNFTFVARTASPTGGSIRHLTGEYDVRITKDKVICYLPYFGRAYTANPASDGGIKFTSEKFEYEAATEKKGRRSVVIRPKDVKDIQRLIFSITADGYADLEVISNNRQQISFTGEIK